MIRLNAFRINLPFDQFVSPATPDLNGDGLRDYISATSWALNNANSQPLVVALQEDFGSFAPAAIRVTGEGGKLEARFPRDILWSDFNGDGIVDLFVIDENESRVEYNGGWKWEGAYQYAYISQGMLNYQKILVSPIKISSHTAAIVESAEGPPAIIYNALGNSLPDVPAMTINRFESGNNTFVTERIEPSDNRLVEGSVSNYYNVFFAIEGLDVNNDGSDDLICMSGLNGENVILLNDGKSNFSYYKNFESGLSTGYVIEEVAKGDFNGDGLLDMLVLAVDRTDGMGQGSLFKTMRVLISDGRTLIDETEAWLGRYFQDRDSSFGYVDTFDLNSDGLSDIVFPHFESETSYQNKSLEILISTGRGFETNTFRNFPDVRVSKLTEFQMFGNDSRYVVETDIRGTPSKDVKSAYYDVTSDDVSLELSDRYISIVGNDFDMLVLRSVADRVAFIDGGRAFDLQGNAGTAAKILGALWGKESVENPAFVGIVLHYLDSGVSYEALLDLALGAILGANKTNEAIVELVFTNLVGEAPTQDVKTELASYMDSGAYSQAGFARAIADLELNATNINLVGLSDTGLQYTEYVP